MRLSEKPLGLKLRGKLRRHLMWRIPVPVRTLMQGKFGPVGPNQQYAKRAAKLSIQLALSGNHRFTRRNAERLAILAPSELHRVAASALLRALNDSDTAKARSIATHLTRVTDNVRVEKLISHRYRFIWLCVPKVASRSILYTLRTHAPIQGSWQFYTSLEDIYERCPETRDYFTFAFVRHPLDRTRSCWADKLALPSRRKMFRKTFVEALPWGIPGDELP